MKILNLYAGIGGNRKLWGNEHEITAVEMNPKIAAIYQDFFHDDIIVVGDAHQYLLDNYKDFDFIWASPPCQSHSRAKFGFGVCGHGYKYEYPDMKLYQEIILLKHTCKDKKWVVENVFPYYEYLINPNYKIARHSFWSNFEIEYKHFELSGGIAGNTKNKKYKNYFDLSKYSNFKNKQILLRNCVVPELGLHILNQADTTSASSMRQTKLFDIETCDG